jgi:hypothetical protein
LRGRKLLGSNDGVSTYDLYTTPVERGTWDVPATGAARFSWEYEEGRQRLLDLYQRGKDKQWDAAKRIDWSLEVDPNNVMATGTSSGSTWDRGCSASSCTASRAR